MSIQGNMLRGLLGEQDMPQFTGLPAGTFMNAGDIGGLMSLIQARQGLPPGLLNGQGTLPPQLQRQPVSFPPMQASGPMGQMAQQMASGTQLPMINPTDLLRRFGNGNV